MKVTSEMPKEAQTRGKATSGLRMRTGLAGNRPGCVPKLLKVKSAQSAAEQWLRESEEEALDQVDQSPSGDEPSQQPTIWDDPYNEREMARTHQRVAKERGVGQGGSGGAGVGMVSGETGGDDSWTQLLAEAEGENNDGDDTDSLSGQTLADDGQQSEPGVNNPYSDIVSNLENPADQNESSGVGDSAAATTTDQGDQTGTDPGSQTQGNQDMGRRFASQSGASPGQVQRFLRLPEEEQERVLAQSQEGMSNYQKNVLSDDESLAGAVARRGWKQREGDNGYRQLKDQERETRTQEEKARRKKELEAWKNSLSDDQRAALERNYSEPAAQWKKYQQTTYDDYGSPRVQRELSQRQRAHVARQKAKEKQQQNQQGGGVVGQIVKFLGGLGGQGQNQNQESNQDGQANQNQNQESNQTGQTSQSQGQGSTTVPQDRAQANWSSKETQMADASGVIGYSPWGVGSGGGGASTGGEAPAVGAARGLNNVDAGFGDVASATNFTNMDMGYNDLFKRQGINQSPAGNNMGGNGFSDTFKV